MSFLVANLLSVLEERESCTISELARLFQTSDVNIMQLIFKLQENDPRVVLSKGEVYLDRSYGLNSIWSVVATIFAFLFVLSLFL